MADSLEHLTRGVSQLIRVVDAIDGEIGWANLTRHVDSLFLIFPDMIRNYDKRGEAHQDDHNVTVRQMPGQTNASMIEFEDDTDEIVKMDNSKTVNTTETENKGESTIETTHDTSNKTVTQETPARNDSIPISSRFIFGRNTLFPTPNAAQTQTLVWCQFYLLHKEYING